MISYNCFAVSQAAELVKAAKKPVIIVGSQATIPPTPVEDVAASLNSMGIPAFLGGMARGLLGAENSIQVKLLWYYHIMAALRYQITTKWLICYK